MCYKVQRAFIHNELVMTKQTRSKACTGLSRRCANDDSYISSSLKKYNLVLVTASLQALRYGSPAIDWYLVLLCTLYEVWISPLSGLESEGLGPPQCFEAGISCQSLCPTSILPPCLSHSSKLSFPRASHLSLLQAVLVRHCSKPLSSSHSSAQPLCLSSGFPRDVLRHLLHAVLEEGVPHHAPNPLPR